MLWWASAFLRLGDVDFLRFSGQGWTSEVEVEKKEEEWWLCRLVELSSIYLFIYYSIFPLHAFTNSVSLSSTSESQVWHWISYRVKHAHAVTNISACSQRRQTMERNTSDLFALFSKMCSKDSATLHKITIIHRFTGVRCWESCSFVSNTLFTPLITIWYVLWNLGKTITC